MTFILGDPDVLSRLLYQGMQNAAPFPWLVGLFGNIQQSHMCSFKWKVSVQCCVLGGLGGGFGASSPPRECFF